MPFIACQMSMLFAAALLAGIAWADSIDAAKAAQVKSAYLKHIAGLTTWPAEKSGAGRPIVIGVIGRDPNGVMAPMLARVRSEQGLQAQGRSIEVIELELSRDAQAVRQCDLLFVTEGGEALWSEVRPLVDGEPIVTVGEMERFTDDGGMIGYLIDVDEGRVRILVNLEAVRRAGIVLSARFLVLESVTVITAEKEA